MSVAQKKSHLYEHLVSFLFHFKNSLDSQLNVIQSLRIVIICIQSQQKIRIARICFDLYMHLLIY